MTSDIAVARRNTLVYYLAAIVAGCVLMSTFLLLLGQGISPVRSARDLPGYYAKSVYTGWWIALVFGFTLRKVTGVIGWERPLEWAIAGIGLAPLVLLALSNLVSLVTHAAPGLTDPASPGTRAIIEFLSNGFAAVAWGGRWGLTSTLAGASTALVLCSVQRGLAARREEPLA